MRRKSLTLLSLLAVTAASVSLAGCSSPNGPPGPTGILTGTLQAAGGPGAAPRALSGHVTLLRSDGARAIISVGANGRFSVPVSVGTYTVSAQSQTYEGGTADCKASTPVTVTKGTTSRVKVDCQQK